MIFRWNNHTGHLKASNEDPDTVPKLKLYVSLSFYCMSHKLHNATCLV
jgi:hypothetical protein